MDEILNKLKELEEQREILIAENSNIKMEVEKIKALSEN
jgi:hypothetical protein